MKYVVYVIMVSMLAACGNVKEQNVSHPCDCNDGMVLEGTDTAVVRISVGSNGIPRVSTEKVVLYPGQRIVWAGPTDMEVKFPQRSPFKENVLRTRDGVINRVIPDVKIKGKEIIYKYDVVVDGKVLDPLLILRKPQ